MRKTTASRLESEVRVPTAAVILATALAGVVLGFVAEPLSILLPGGRLVILVEFLAAATWLLDRWQPCLARWLAIGDLIVFILSLHSMLSAPGILCLLAVPTALAAAAIGVRTAALTATAESVLLLAFAHYGVGNASPAAAAVALIAVWSMVGVMVATYLPVYQFSRWSWDQFRNSQGLLDEARDRRAELKQALDDLAAANLQLTRLNRLTQGLRHAAEEATRTKEQFVANVSHELRTPLNMIIGFSELIMQTPEAYGDGGVPPALLADLDVILRNSQHLADLIDDVLDLSQIEVGRMALTKERVSPEQIVEAAVAVVRPLFEGKDLYLLTEVTEGLPPILCDRTRVREVLVNLLSNAGRFTECGGVELRAWREENEVVFSVGDTGPGIAPEDEGKVFRPFEQLDGSLRRRYGGSGLGLSISRAFVELHGGTMWFESTEGQGTTFFFRLPVDPPVAADSGIGRWFSPYLEYQERSRRPAAIAPVVRPRFVILEARRGLQRILRRYLDDAEIVPVADLEEAMEELSRVPAQALLVNDVSVPAALQRFLQAAQLPYGTPAILCSVPGASEAGDALGVDDYLVKPISRTTLLAALERIQPKGKTILVVDDDPEALQLFRRMLGSLPQGYRVLRASDAMQALSMLRTERPDALLLDLVMPGMDGFQLLAEKGADPALREIPTLIISAQDPGGQPVVTTALALIRGGGLSIPQLLDSIGALTRILSPGQVADPGQSASRAG